MTCGCACGMIDARSRMPRMDPHSQNDAYQILPGVEREGRPSIQCPIEIIFTSCIVESAQGVLFEITAAFVFADAIGNEYVINSNVALERWNAHVRA
jgi:hypothetical protein